MPQRPSPHLSRELKAGDQRYVWIRCDYSSRDLKPGSVDWRLGRIICYGIDKAGVGMFQRPHSLAPAQGTQPWSSDEAVFELDPRMEHVWVAVQNMGTSGEFAVRDFQVAFVRDRPALGWQVPLLLLAWCVWLVGLIRVWFMSTVPIWRCVLGAGCVLTLFWFLALPGITTIVRPLAPGQFAGLYQPPPQISTFAVNSLAAPSSPVQPSATAIPSAPAASEEVKQAPPANPRRTPMLEWVNRKWDMLHAAVFFGLTIALLVLTGIDAIWRISAGTTGVIQGVEWLELGFLGISDAVEVFWACIGITVAVWIWKRWCRRRTPVQRKT
ncbi:MAG TPA: hypothetical protein VEH04_19055 [Verrucomicrobiae bacterium]|nr:hypothetical protein [Verrucomicrobiae bacterium]